MLREKEIYPTLTQIPMWFLSHAQKVHPDFPTIAETVIKQGMVMVNLEEELKHRKKVYKYFYRVPIAFIIIFVCKCNKTLPTFSEKKVFVVKKTLFNINKIYRVYH